MTSFAISYFMLDTAASTVYLVLSILLFSFSYYIVSIAAALGRCGFAIPHYFRHIDIRHIRRCGSLSSHFALSPRAKLPHFIYKWIWCYCSAHFITISLILFINMPPPHTLLNGHFPCRKCATRVALCRYRRCVSFYHALSIFLLHSDCLLMWFMPWFPALHNFHFWCFTFCLSEMSHHFHIFRHRNEYLRYFGRKQMFSHDESKLQWS